MRFDNTTRKWKIVGATAAVVAVGGLGAVGVNAASGDGNNRNLDTIALTESIGANDVAPSTTLAFDGAQDSQNSVSRNSPVSANSPASPVSANSPASVNSPASPVSFNSPASPVSYNSPASANSAGSVDSP